MATYYVNTGQAGAADNTTDGRGSTSDKAWKTIAYAIANVDAGDEIEVATGTYAEGTNGLAPAACNYSASPVRIYSQSGVAADVIVTNSTADKGTSFTVVNAVVRGLTFEDMTFQHNGTGAGYKYSILFYGAPSAGTSHITFNRCAIPIPAVALYKGVFMDTTVGTGGIDHLAFNNCTFAVGDAANSVIELRYGAHSNITISGCTMTSANAGSVSIYITGGVGVIPDGITISGNTITAGYGPQLINCRSMTVSNNTITTPGAYSLLIGTDTDVPQATDYAATVTGNTIVNSAVEGHSILLGRGTAGCTASNNNVSASGNAAYGIIDKGTGNTITGNTISVPLAYGCLYSKGSDGGTYTGNVLSTATGNLIAASGEDNSAWRDNADVTISGTVGIVTGAGQVYTVATADAGDNYVTDGNVWLLTGTGADYGTILAATNVASLTAARTAWGDTNDATSAPGLPLGKASSGVYAYA